MKLFWKFFFFLGIAMTLTVVLSIIMSFRFNDQMTDQLDIENREEIIQEAAYVLEQGGEPALRAWLDNNPNPAPGFMLVITDERGRDLLDRDIPEEVRENLVRSARRVGPPSNFQRFRWAWVLIGDHGQRYPLMFMRTELNVLGVLTLPATQVSVLTSAIIVAALTALLLAGYMSSSIVKLQQASRSLAAGALDTRVGAPFNRRRDEIGALARDFDAMAEKLQALITDKETLLRDVSHELRSPLARIRVGLALAQRKANEASQHDLERIEQEVERLDQLVGQIMTLTRLRTQTEVRRESVDLVELVGEAVENARFEHPKAEIRFEHDAVGPLLGNADELYSAIENVVRNAVSFTADAPVEVALRDEGGRVVISIADGGSGVPEDELERIFEPFYRADTSRDHQRDGQGIGLSITASVVQRHGGRVTARNRPAGGLEVRLELLRHPPS